jgi:hypothetical protein
VTPNSKIECTLQVMLYDNASDSSSFVCASMVLLMSVSPNSRFMAEKVDSTLLRRWWCGMNSSIR